MGVEIERKFLVRDERWRAQARAGQRLVQAYLCPEPKRCVRVRLEGDDEACLTIKGESRGLARTEFEYAIPVEDARQMIDELCLQPAIEKTRYRVVVGEHTWEIDVFEGANRGLVLAEVELDDAAELPQMPAWVGEEVSGQARYYNLNLVRKPYQGW